MILFRQQARVVLGVSLLIASMFTAGCDYLDPKPINTEATLDGPIEGLNARELSRHTAGDAHFNDEIFTTETGLGPLFVANSCGSCHAGDGKGHPSTVLTRFGQSDTLGVGKGWLGAPQWQNRSIAGHEAETLPPGAPMTRLIAPLVSGTGYLEFVSDSALYALSDPSDRDRDGISGKPNWIAVPDYVQAREGAIIRNGRYIGRFGKKAAAYDLTHQTSVAYNQDMGITSANEARDTYTGLAIDPEITQAKLSDVVHYMATLKSPPRRDASNADVLEGEVLFAEIGCAKCHAPTLTTGASPIEPLSRKTFHPYTDLMLHDMGPGLNDGYTEGRAEPAEWKTPPLWGLGLAPKSQGGQYHLLHDGRANSIEQAILLHGGEADAVKARYIQLEESKRGKLLSFLKSL